MNTPTLCRLWLLPPLAFARLGNSRTALDAFYWGRNEDTPEGTGKTTIQPAETLYFRDDGTLFPDVPSKIRFSDENGIRPVCPFFELHGEWTSDAGLVRGPVTAAMVDPSRLKWQVEVANLKPFNMTRDPQTAIRARLEMPGDEVSENEIQGISAPEAAQPLVPKGRYIPLGRVRLSKPNSQFPGFRLRFYPACGATYGPSDPPENRKANIPAERLFLNPASSWCAWKQTDDPRRVPEGQFAKDPDGVSLGLVDDICDGFIRCSIEGVAIPPACARIVVGPPDYAPDRRPVVSLADGLKDRVDRHDVLASSYFDDMALASGEIRDLMERAFEAMGLMNLDALNDYFDGVINRNIAKKTNVDYPDQNNCAFPRLAATESNPLPLTAEGREHHRRYLVLEVFTDFVRKRPDLVRHWIRSPMTLNPFFTRQMPTLMRGSTGDPLHLTRRQYQLIAGWLQRLQTMVTDEARGGS